MTTTPCPKCGGSGYLPHFARTDGGKCWACTDRAVQPTAETLADDEAYRAEMALGLTLAERMEIRRARKAAEVDEYEEEEFRPARFLVPWLWVAAPDLEEAF